MAETRTYCGRGICVTRSVTIIELRHAVREATAAVYQCPGCGACGKIDPHNYVAVVQHADDCPRMDEYEEQR